LHNEGLHKLYSAQHFIRAVKSKQNNMGRGYHEWERWDVRTVFWLKTLKERYN
jgi:hypothetical protein